MSRFVSDSKQCKNATAGEQNNRRAVNGMEGVLFLHSSRPKLPAVKIKMN